MQTALKLEWAVCPCKPAYLSYLDTEVGFGCAVVAKIGGRESFQTPFIDGQAATTAPGVFTFFKPLQRAVDLYEFGQCFLFKEMHGSCWRGMSDGLPNICIHGIGLSGIMRSGLAEARLDFGFAQQQPGFDHARCLHFLLLSAPDQRGRL
jgi:hypothetical protein